jgi:Rad3-related DNA helicase
MRVPRTPGELGLRVPQNSWRPNQRDVIEEIINADEQAILLEAPTGFGKSLVAAALARIVRGRTIILTQTNQLQDQYLRDFPFMRKSVGKDHFACILPDAAGMPVSEAPCQSGWKCHLKAECPYFVQNRQAASAGVLTTSYAKAMTSWIPSPALMICDEGHLLERQILNSYTIRLRYEDFAKNQMPVPAFGTINEAANWATGKLAIVQNELAGLQPLLRHDADHKAMKSFRHRYFALKSIERTLNALSNADSGALWSIEPYKQMMAIRPIWATDHARKLFGAPEKLVIQSATVLDPARLARILGLRHYRYITLPSSFPKSRRPIYYWPVAKVGMKSDEAALARIIEAVDVLLEKYPKRRGIVHTVNWTLTKAIGERSRHKDRLIVQPPGKKRGWGIDKFLNTPHAVLVSPSVTTGLDGKFEKARFQILVKLPFENQSEAAVAERLDADHQWYAYQCAFHIQQMSGRVMRDYWDYGETWILDEHFGWFSKQNWHLFSDWFKEALIHRTLR